MAINIENVVYAIFVRCKCVGYKDHEIVVHYHSFRNRINAAVLVCNQQRDVIRISFKVQVYL